MSFAWTEALSGQIAFYHCSGDEPCVAALNWHAPFDLWFLRHIKGVKKRTSSTRRSQDIANAFAEAGYHHVTLGRVHSMVGVDL